MLQCKGLQWARLAPLKTGKSTGAIVRYEDIWDKLRRRSEVRAEVTQSNLQHAEYKNGLALDSETHSLLQATTDFSTATGGGGRT